MHLDLQPQLSEEELTIVARRKTPMTIGSLRGVEEEKEKDQAREATVVRSLTEEGSLLVIREIMITDRNQEGGLPVEQSRLTFAMQVVMRIDIEAPRVKLRRVVEVVKGEEGVEGVTEGTMMILEIREIILEI